MSALGLLRSKTRQPPSAHRRQDGAEAAPAPETGLGQEARQWASAQPRQRAGQQALAEAAPCLPSTIESFGSRHLATRARSEDVRRQLTKLSAYLDSLNTASFTNIGSLTQRILEAKARANRSHFASKLAPGAGYRAVQADMTRLVQQELAVLDRTQALAESLAKADRSLNHHDFSLAELAELVRQPAMKPKELLHRLNQGYTLRTLAGAHRLGLKPRDLRKVFCRSDFAWMRSMDHSGAGIEQKAYARLIAYRQALPDLPRSQFLPLARKAFTIDLPPQYLQPMLLAGVPIEARLVPTQTFRRVADDKPVPLAGGMSGSPVSKVRLVGPDGTTKLYVKKVLNWSPVVSPSNHLGAGIPFPMNAIGEAFTQAFTQAHPQNQEPSAEQSSQAQASLWAAVRSACLKGESVVRWDLSFTGLPKLQGVVLTADMPVQEGMPVTVVDKLLQGFERRVIDLTGDPPSRDLMETARGSATAAAGAAAAAGQTTVRWDLSFSGLPGLQGQHLDRDILPRDVYQGLRDQCISACRQALAEATQLPELDELKVTAQQMLDQLLLDARAAGKDAISLDLSFTGIEQLQGQRMEKPIPAPRGDETTIEQLVESFAFKVTSATEKTLTNEQRQQAVAILMPLVLQAAIGGQSTVTLDLSGIGVEELNGRTITLNLPAPPAMPNLYGRDRAMRELADILGRPDQVAPVHLAVIDGEYCEIAEFNPDLSREVIASTGDAVLPIADPALQTIVRSMTDAQLQSLAHTRGFERAIRESDGQAIRFQLKPSSGMAPERWLNRLDPDDTDLRRDMADHHVRNWLANESDAHNLNASTRASWDHDGSFGVTEFNKYQAMPTVVSQDMWERLQDDHWNAHKQRLEGLITRQEMAALEDRRQRLIASGPQIIQPLWWHSEDATQGMGLDRLQSRVDAVEKALEKAGNSGVHPAQSADVKAALRELSELVGVGRELDQQTMAREATEWLIASYQARIDGQPQTAFYDQTGWERDIRLMGSGANAPAVDAPARPAWAALLGRHFDLFIEQHGDVVEGRTVLHAATFALKEQYADAFMSLRAASTNEFESHMAKAREALSSIRSPLAKLRKDEATQALVGAIDAELASWDRLASMVADVKGPIGHVSLHEWLTLEQTERFDAENEQPAPALEAADVDELLHARATFAPGMPLDYFLALKRAFLPVTQHTAPDLDLSARISAQAPQKLGSGNVATVWKVKLEDGSSWALKAEPEKFPEAAFGHTKDLGIATYDPPKNPRGPNLTGRTLATARLAQALGVDSAPEAKPVVFRDPATGKLVYGAASRLIKGEMLQSAKGRTVNYKPNQTTRAALKNKDLDRIQAVIKGMGFSTARWSKTDKDRIVLTPETEYRRTLDWSDPELRRSSVENDIVALISGQGDNHAGNYMVTKDTTTGGRRLVSIDNDLSFGTVADHPLKLAGERIDDAWADFLKRGAHAGSRPPVITDGLRAKLVAMNVDEVLKAYPKSKVNGKEPNEHQINSYRAEVQSLLDDLARPQDQPGAIAPAIGEWIRRVTVGGNGSTHAAGIPQVISRSLVEKLLALEEAQVKNDICGGLSPAEQNAAWQRTQVLQGLVRDNTIETIDDDAWADDTTRDRLGLRPETLRELARKDVAAAEGTPAGDGHRMQHGLAAVFALEERSAREQADRVLESSQSKANGTPRRYKGFALFAQAFIDEQLQTALQS